MGRQRQDFRWMWSLVSDRLLAYSNGIAAIAPVACHVWHACAPQYLIARRCSEARGRMSEAEPSPENDPAARTAEIRQCLEMVDGRRSFPGHGAHVSRSANGGGLLRGYLQGIRTGRRAVRRFALVVSLGLRAHATAGGDDGRSASPGDDLRAGRGPLVRWPAPRRPLPAAFAR